MDNPPIFATRYDKPNDTSLGHSINYKALTRCVLINEQPSVQLDEGLKLKETDVKFIFQSSM